MSSGNMPTHSHTNNPALLVPDRRSRIALRNLHRNLAYSILIVVLSLMVLLALRLDLSTNSLLSYGVAVALFLTAFISPFVELGVVLYNRRRFRVNAFLKGSYLNLVNYQLSCCFYSLIYAVFLTVFALFSPMLAIRLLFPEYVDTPGVGGALSFILGPILIIVFLVFCVPVFTFLVMKLCTITSSMARAARGKPIKYPFAISFLR